MIDDLKEAVAAIEAENPGEEAGGFIVWNVPGGMMTVMKLGAQNMQVRCMMDLLEPALGLAVKP
jgi:hypothetical protein